MPAKFCSNPIILASSKPVCDACDKFRIGAEAILKDNRIGIEEFNTFLTLAKHNPLYHAFVLHRVKQAERNRNQKRWQF